MLIAFEMETKAILVVGGDKSDDWTGWYEINIPIADDRFDEHQAKIAKRREKEMNTKKTKNRNVKGRGRK